MVKLFRITVVFFVAIVSVTFIAVLLTGIASMLPLPMTSHTDGIAAVPGGVSVKLFRALLVAAVLLVGGCYLFWRRRRLR
ncbi:MAG TPA: hypothetical protein VGJ37_14310 [Pyrinomonadaceae bacterium]|jgi:hypothetical protein